MANIILEGFDHMPIGTLASTGSPWIASGFDWPEVTTTTPITGSRSVIIGSGNGGGYFTRSIAPATNEVWFGYSVVPASFANPQFNRAPGVQGASSFFSVNMNSTGRLVACRQDTTLSTSTNPVFTVGVKAYIEVHITTTTYEVLIDGTPILSGSMTSIGNFTAFLITRNGTGSQYKLDDLYVNDNSGTVNNGYLGEISVVYLFPDDDLSPADWTITGTTEGYQSLDNVPPSGTEYITASAAGNLSNFQIPVIPFEVADIHVVKTIFRAQKTTAGASTARLNLIQDGTTSNGTTRTLTENTYNWYEQIYNLDPDTGLAWDETTFDPTIQLERIV